MNNVQSGSTTSKKRVRGQDCTGLVKNLMEDIDLGDSSPKKSKKKDAEASPSNISAVHDGASPSPVQSKLSSNPQDPITISSPNDQKGATESSIVMKRIF
ncbi:hypothetical protein QN277_010544 [Acacia crassicarpa]|uniref:Uncharacterized protein n=1 Tax=Acacia crassicarpa TaxID=499986 RepID=A0AAE1IPZ3_9FABA|nr:hypothetical protein QN277_010544 [Acacia crassicarpa]